MKSIFYLQYLIHVYESMFHKKGYKVWNLGELLYSRVDTTLFCSFLAAKLVEMGVCTKRKGGNMNFLATFQDEK